MLGMTNNITMDFGMLGFGYDHGYHTLNVNTSTAFWAVNETVDSSILIVPNTDY
jgi:hypothetical protein